MPCLSAPATTERFDSEVSMITGVLSPRSRMFWSMVGPSMLGMVTSSSTRSNLASRSRVSPCTPSSASPTSKPSSRTCFATMVRTARLSSTVKMVAMGASSSGGLGETFDDPENEPHLLRAQDDRVLAVGGGNGRYTGDAVDDLGQAERLVERHQALEQPGGHVDELAERVVHHGLVNRLWRAAEHGGAERGAAAAVGGEADGDGPEAGNGQDRRAPHQMRQLRRATVGHEGQAE